MSRRRDPGSRPEESEQAERLKEAIERERENIDRGISVLVYKLCSSLRPGELRDRVEDIRQETIREALTNPARYDPSRPPVAWLLGIAANSRASDAKLVADHSRSL